MLILLAVLLAVAALVAYQLMKTANSSAGIVEGQANATMNSACSINPVAGCPCGPNNACATGYTCDTSTNKCN